MTDSQLHQVRACQRVSSNSKPDGQEQDFRVCQVATPCKVCGRWRCRVQGDGYTLAWRGPNEYLATRFGHIAPAPTVAIVRGTEQGHPDNPPRGVPLMVWRSWSEGERIQYRRSSALADLSHETDVAEWFARAQLYSTPARWFGLNP